MKKTFLLLTITILICWYTTKCGNEDRIISSEESKRPTQINISKQQYGEEWPFTVNSGYIICDKSAIVFIAEEKQYSVNGVAKNRFKDNSYFFNIEDITLPDDELNRLELRKKDRKWKKSIGFVLEKGKTLCR